MNKTTRIISAFAVGAAAGAVLGMLLVPGKGADKGKKAGADDKKLCGTIKSNLREVRERLGRKEKEEEYV